MGPHTPAASGGDLRPASELGKNLNIKENPFYEIIYKPVKQSDLFDSLQNVLSSKPTKTSWEKIKVERASIKASDIRILVADDIAANQLLSLKLLENLGYNANAVANGKEVLEAIEQIPYDLILMDCQMPEMNGFDATRLIRENEKITGKHILIIALTANAMEGDDKKCIAAGMDDYLSKPIKKEKLNEMLLKWLSTEKNKKLAA